MLHGALKRRGGGVAQIVNLPTICATAMRYAAEDASCLRLFLDGRGRPVAELAVADLAPGPGNGNPRGQARRSQKQRDNG
jgi:hypothetical protein